MSDYNSKNLKYYMKGDLEYQSKYLKYYMKGDLEYQSKYLKYKKKYLQLKHGGMPLPEENNEEENKEENKDCNINFKENYGTKLQNLDESYKKIDDEFNKLLNIFKNMHNTDPEYNLIRSKIAELDNQRKEYQYQINKYIYIYNNDLFFEKYNLYKTNEMFNNIIYSKKDEYIKEIIKMDSLLFYGDINFLMTKSLQYDKNIIKGFKILTRKQQELQNILIKEYKNVPVNHSRCFELFEEILLATKYDILDETNIDRFLIIKDYYSMINNNVEPPFTLDMITESGKICKTPCKKHFLYHYCNNANDKEEKCNIKKN